MKFPGAGADIFGSVFILRVVFGVCLSGDEASGDNRDEGIGDRVEVFRKESYDSSARSSRRRGKCQASPGDPGDGVWRLPRPLMPGALSGFIVEMHVCGVAVRKVSR
jgi:hypothetical protein